MSKKVLRRNFTNERNLHFLDKIIWYTIINIYIATF